MLAPAVECPRQKCTPPSGLPRPFLASTLTPGWSLVCGRSVGMSEAKERRALLSARDGLLPKCSQTKQLR